MLIGSHLGHLQVALDINVLVEELNLRDQARDQDPGNPGYFYPKIVGMCGCE